MQSFPPFDVNSQDVAVVEPCTSETGALMLDFNLFQFLAKKGHEAGISVDFGKLKTRVEQGMPKAAKAQVSTRLGLAKITCPAWDIVIARSGRIIIRRGKSRDALNQAVNFVFKLLNGTLASS